MDFELLLDSLHRFAGPLPGPSAHARMVNYARPMLRPELAINEETRMSGVMVLLFPEGTKAHVALMKRTDYKGVHGGQISFPGGKKEHTDRDLLQTALRETHEEVGIPAEMIQLVGELSPVFIPPSNFFVKPFIGILAQKPLFSPDPREVAEILSMPLDHLSAPESIVERSVFISLLNQQMPVRCYELDGNIVWGATAMMLAELGEILFEFK